MTATSSALAERTAPPFVAAAAAGPAASWPNAPKRTFAIERFIARPMRIVSRVPEAPTSIPLTIRTLFSSSKPVAAAARPVKALRNSASETRAAAPPPTPLKSATICGIAVIFTLRAATAPKTPPTAIPTRISQTLSICFCAKVTPIAISIPTAPIQFPRRAVAGCERNLRARMNATIVARYARSVATRPIVLLGRVAPLEHLEHAVGDDEAADDVGRGERHRDESDDRRQRVLVAEA